MKDLSIAVEKITGKPSENCVCGVFKKNISLSDSKTGTLVSCILISGEGADLHTVLTSVFELVQSKLEESQEGMLDALKSTISPSKNLGGSLDISFIHVLFWEDACYIARLGDKVKLLVFDPPKSVEIDFESGSGPVLGGQIYILATDAFLSVFDTSVFAQEAEVDFEEIIDGVATEIADEEKQSEIGAAFVQIRGEVKEEAQKEAEEDVGEEEVKEKETQEIEEKVEEPAGEEGAEVPKVLSQREQEEEAFGQETEIGTVRRPSKFSGILRLPKVLLSAVFFEVGKIRRGDIGAIRKNIVLVAIIVVLILASSVGFALYRSNQKEKLSQFNGYFSSATAKYSEAVAILDLNKARAREILIEADRDVKLALEIKPNDEDSKKLASDIVSKLKETEVASNVEFGEVFDGDDSIRSLGFLQNNIAAVSGESVFEVDVESDTSEEFSTKSGVSAGFVYDGKAFVISGVDVLRFDLADGSEVKVGEVSGGLDIWVFFGNVYVLSAESITKFQPVEGGYSEGSEYLNNAEKFSSKSRFAIDASIWATSGNKVLKFTRGDREDFEISGIVGGVGEFSLIYTDANLENLYVVDSTNSALLVISKDGVYQKVLQSPEFARASDLVVDEASGKLYISAGPKILEASIE